MLPPLLLIGQLVMCQPVQPPVLHACSWQSCDHEERVLEHRVLGKLHWELHLGPDDEFALYDHQVDGEEHSHATVDNLLGPDYHVSGDNYRARREWLIPQLHLKLNITAAGGSRDECQSFWLQVTKTKER